MLSKQQIAAVTDGIKQIKAIAKEQGVSEAVVATVIGTLLAKQPISKTKETDTSGGA